MLELPGKHRNGTTFIFTASGPGTAVNQQRWTISQSYTILIKGLTNISFTSIVFDRCNTIFVASMVMLRDVDLPYTQLLLYTYVLIVKRLHIAVSPDNRSCFLFIHERTTDDHTID